MKAPEKDVSPLLRAAMAAQQQGAIRDARRLYEQALRVAPRNADSLHLLGLTWIDDGQTERGLQLIRRAIAYRPDYLEAINNIAIELAKLDRHAEAQVFLEKALRLNEAQPDVQYNLGRSLNALGQLQDALASYDRAVALRPGHHEAWNNRGLVLYSQQDMPGAIASYDRALELKPDYAEAWVNRGICLHDQKNYAPALGSFDNALAADPDNHAAWLRRGYTLLDTKQYDFALAALDRCITIAPDNPAGWTVRSIVLNEMKHFDRALADNDKAIALRTDHVDAWISRCWIFYRTRRLDDALACIHKALNLEPDNPMALANQGVVLGELKRTDAALASLNRAITVAPKMPEARLSRAYTRLSLGHLAESWADYEYRWQAWANEVKRPVGITAPEWRGEALRGRHILVYTEQGMGDILHFIRYLPLMQAQGARITFLVVPQLHRLLGPSLPGVVLSADSGNVGALDFQVPLLSLPMHMATDLATIPGDVPYLAAEPALTTQWRERLGANGFRVGIAWQGNPQGNVDVGRSFPVAQFVALADLPDLRLISLQKGFGAEQLLRLPEGMTVETLGAEFDAGPDAFVDTAAVMQALDLVITSDTSIVHLAGALARPAWLALKYVPDWRWFQDRADSPWYPTMRLFRQTTPGDWDGVFREIRRALEEEMR